MSTPKIVIYTADNCPYCTMAKKLLDSKGLSYSEINIANDSEKRKALMQKSGGRRTVPQIFINDEHIGGCDELMALESAGHLDALLRGQS